MAVHIRLQRKGATHRPFYQIVAADQRSPRDGRCIEKLGYFNPLGEQVFELRQERLQYWYERGAQMTDAVARLLRRKNLQLSRKPA